MVSILLFPLVDPTIFFVETKRKYSAVEEARSWGVDLSLIEANLERSPTERLEVLQQALDTIFELRRAWDHAQHQDHPAKASGK